MSPVGIIVVYCVLIVIASLLGGWLPTRFRFTHTGTEMLMSFVGGLMLGIGLLHLLPHAVGSISMDQAMIWMMAGLLVTFFLIRIFHSHDHAPMSEDEEGSECDHHDHQGEHAHHHGDDGEGSRLYSWIGVTLGLTIHTLLDGVALAAAVAADAAHVGEPGAADVTGMGLFGVAIFLGVLLHKPLDSMSISSLMSVGGWSLRARQLVNLGYSMMCPLGALLFYFGIQQSSAPGVIIGCALAFSAGIFVCIALGDLLPELQFHSHDRVKLSTLLLAGIATAYLIGFLEPPHVHHGDSPPQVESHEGHESHSDHDSHGDHGSHDEH